MAPDAATIAQYVVPFIMPHWISVWYWRYYALYGATVAARWIRRYYRLYGIPFIDDDNTHHPTTHVYP